MRPILSSLACCLYFASTAFSQPIFFAEGTTSNELGGLVIIRRGGQTTWSMGGILFPRTVKVVTPTPEGKEIARFRYPSVFHQPHAQDWLPSWTPASLQIEIPDVHGLIYVDGELIRTAGNSRQLESPPLPSGKTFPLRLRAAFAVGDKLMIEDKEVLIGAGETIRVTFDGSRAVAVDLPKSSFSARSAPSER